MFFDNEMSRRDWMIMGALWLAMAVPFIFVMKSMSDSLQIIAQKR